METEKWVEIFHQKMKIVWRRLGNRKYEKCYYFYYYRYYKYYNYYNYYK